MQINSDFFENNLKEDEKNDRNDDEVVVVGAKLK